MEKATSAPAALVSGDLPFYCLETGIYSSKYPKVAFPEDEHVDVVSFVFSHHHEGTTALVDAASGSSIHYKDLFPLVNSLAYGLQNMGVGQGDAVLIVLHNSILYPVVFMSVLYLGAIAVPINPLNSLEEIGKDVLQLLPKLAFTGVECKEKMASFSFPAVCVPEALNVETEKFRSFYDLLRGEGIATPFRRPKVAQDDTATILFSSGTTGRRKAVMLSHKSWISSVALMVRSEAALYDSPCSSSVHLAVIPMFHIYGLSYFALGVLSLGSCVVTMKKFNPDDVVYAIDKYAVTHFSVVPPLLKALMRSARTPLMSLKQVCCGAAPLPPPVIKQFTETFPHIDFIQGYGMTESPGLAARGFNTANIKKFTSVGLITANGQAKVVDMASGLFQPPGCAGEICLRGNGLMKGYLNDEKATRETIDEDGWLHTGDIGYFDEDGYLFIVDRIKDTIKYKGFQVVPAELEEILTGHPEIVDAAVVGIADEESGELPAAFVARKPGSMLSEGEIVDYVARKVAPHKKVRKVFFIDHIPRTTTGKILKEELRNSLRSRL